MQPPHPLSASSRGDTTRPSPAIPTTRQTGKQAGDRLKCHHQNTRSLIACMSISALPRPVPIPCRPVTALDQTRGTQEHPASSSCMAAEHTASAPHCSAPRPQLRAATAAINRQLRNKPCTTLQPHPSGPTSTPSTPWGAVLTSAHTAAPAPSSQRRTQTGRHTAACQLRSQRPRRGTCARGVLMAVVVTRIKGKQRHKTGT